MSRTRTRGALYTVPIRNVTAYTDHVDPPTLLQNVTVGTESSMTDVVTPRYMRRSKNGEIINSPMSSFTHTFSRINGSFVMTPTSTPPPGGAVSGTWDGNPMTVDFDGLLKANPLYDWSKLITEASTLALANVQSPDVNSLPFLAQIGQSLKTLRNPLGNVKRFLRAYANKETSRRRAGMAGAVASQHLEIMFGVLPFINDIRGILRTIQAPPKPPRNTARGKASRTAVWKGMRPYRDFASITGTITDESVRTVTVRAYVLYETEYQGLPDRLGLSLNEIPSTMWELLPYSFLIDEFLNIGKIIDALKPKLGVKIINQGYTAKCEDKLTSTLGECRLIGTPSWVGSGGGEQRICIRVEKYRNPTNLSNNIGLVFNPRINTSIITTDIALITQKLSKLYR